MIHLPCVKSYFESREKNIQINISREENAHIQHFETII
jgi:hypothetical protein